MFAIFDDLQFPKIYIKLSKVEDDTDFENFLQKWESYDNFKKEYTFIFDTRNVEFVPLKYACNMSNFILNLKNKKKQNNSVFLSKSIIVCTNFYIRKLLEMIFLLQTPVANVYIVDDFDKVENLYNKLTFSPHFYDSSVTLFSSK